jgi:hypothetical protein
MTQRIPRIFGITPAATYIATAQANEICRLARMKSLTLNGVEIFDQRQTATTAEICFGTFVTH